MKRPFTDLTKACCALVFLILTASTSVTAQYCTSAATDIDDAWMTNVTFAGIDNDSEDDLYSDFTAISGTVVPGATYSFSATVSYGTTNWTEKAGLWIDWDQNEVFDESEFYVTETCNTEGCVLTTDVEVPFTAVPGETRMRVQLRYGTAPIFNPCGEFTYDEVEDYSILVESGECTPPNFTYTVTNDCEADTYDVSSVINDYGTNSFVTIFVTRSDDAPTSTINVPAVAIPVGSTVPIIEDVPFGVTVSISVEGQNPTCNLTRNFVELICPAENDEACTATELVCGDVLSDQVFLGASQSYDDACGGSGTGDVWFSFIADGTQSYTVAETQTDVVVDLWEGDDCGNLTQVSACADFPESVTVYAAGNYFFRIRPWGTATTYGVSLTCAPFDCEELGGDINGPCDDGDAGTVNDEITADCECIGEPIATNDEACTATLLECGDDLTDLSFAGSSQSYDDECGGSGLGDVWFTFVSDGSQSYEIAETQTDVVVDLWIGDDCGELTQVSACADFPENVTVTEAGTYFFRIRPWGSATTYGVSLTCTAFECPDLLANIGDACDDGNEGTLNDLVTAECECLGTIPATNDEPCTAIALACNDTLVDQTFLGATVSIVDNCTNPTNGDVWYSFTAEAGTAYQINEPSFNSTTASLYIAEDGDCNTLTEVESCTTFFNTFTITEPGDYFFRIRAYSTAISHSVGLVCVDIPENDECSEALDLVCGETYTGSTLGSTAYTNLPTGTCGTSLPNAGNGGVWYTFTPDNDTEIDLDLSGSLYDTKLFVYSGTCEELVCVTGDDDGGDGVDSRVQTTLVSGTTYYIFVTGFGANRGEFVLNVSCVDLECSPTIESAVAVDSEGTPVECVNVSGSYYLEVTLAGGTQSAYNVSAGDSPSVVISADATGIVGPISGGDATVNATGVDNTNCGAALLYEVTACPPTNDEACNATPIFCGDVITQNFEGATLSLDDACFGSGLTDVWLTFEADGTQAYTIAETGAAFFDAVVGLYQGDDCGNLVSVASCQDFPESYEVTAAGTYYFYIRPYSSFSTVTVTDISLTCTPFDCPELGNIGGPCNDGDAGTYDDEILADCSCAGTVYDCTEINANIGDACDDGDAGTVNDEITADCECIGEPVAVNDEACTATVLECGDALTGLSFAGSSQSYDDACFGSGTGDVWFSFEASGDQAYSIAETSSGDMVVDLWMGDDCGDLVNVNSCIDFPETFTVSEQGIYYFRIRPYSTASTYAVSLTCVDFAENDEACTATVLECGDALTGLSFAGSTQSYDDACFGSGTGDVWVSFVADGTQTYLIAETSSSDMVVDLWIGDDCGELTQVSSCADFPETVEVSAAGTYYFRIRPYSTATTYAVSLTCTAFECPDLLANIGDACDDGDANTLNDVITEDCECLGTPIPVNDACADALPLVCGETYTGSTVAADVHSGLPEGTCGTTLPNADNGGVWYVITPEQETDITLDLTGSNFDTKIYLFTGACDALECVDGDDDGGEGTQSLLEATLDAGTTYYVFVSGFASNRGNFVLNTGCVVSNTAAFNGSVSWNSNCDDRESTVTFYEVNTATVAATYTTSVNSAGEFTIAEVLVGTYDIIVDVPGYLNKGLADVVTVAGENSVDFGAITFGDTNDNNGFNVSDFSVVLGAFGSQTGDANYNLYADLNCSGQVNVSDFSLLTTVGFGQSGAVAPLP